MEHKSLVINAGIISIGDELLLGNTVNTNSAWLGQKLTHLGININTSVVIQDDEDKIIESLKEVSNQNRVIITTGGLGPTNDDITKKSIAKYFGADLVENEVTKSKLIEYFNRKNREFTETHKEQALLPSCSQPLNNSVGTAPGIYTYFEGKHYFSLPGIPQEMKSIFEENIIDIVNKIKLESNSDYYIYKTIYTTGIVESEIYQRISKYDIENKDIRFAYLPSYTGVKIRIGFLKSYLEKSADGLELLFNNIKSELQSYIIEENCDINQALLKLLISNKLNISVAESCTGGGLGSLLSELPGSSKILQGGFIVYSNEAKQNILNVKQKTLNDFGAVSKETALEMARNCREIMQTDFAVSVTGIAGPEGGSEKKPVGTVWIGISNKNNTVAKKYIFLNNREANRELSKYTALSLLYRKIKYNVEI